MRRPGRPGPIATSGSIRNSEVLGAPQSTTTPYIFVGAYGGVPGALGQKAGDIACDSDAGVICIADAYGAWQQVYP